MLESVTTAMDTFKQLYAKKDVCTPQERKIIAVMGDIVYALHDIKAEMIKEKAGQD